jgi:hypothetical protein
MHTSLYILVLSIGLGVPAAILHDRLLRHQYLHHRSAWDADGSFDGLFWHVDGAVSAMQPKGFAPRNWGRTASLWLYHTPPWVDSPPPCRGLLYAYRICTAVYILAFIVVMITFVTDGSARSSAMPRTVSKATTGLCVFTNDTYGTCRVTMARVFDPVRVKAR